MVNITQQSRPVSRAFGTKDNAYYAAKAAFQGLSGNKNRKRSPSPIDPRKSSPMSPEATNMFRDHEYDDQVTNHSVLTE